MTKIKGSEPVGTHATLTTITGDAVKKILKNLYKACGSKAKWIF
jgi:hypothetical protein